MVSIDDVDEPVGLKDGSSDNEDDDDYTTEPSDQKAAEPRPQYPRHAKRSERKKAAGERAHGREPKRMLRKFIQTRL